MISAKAVIVIGLTSLFIGSAAVVLVFFGVPWARQASYAAIFIGAVAVTVGGIAASIGRVKNDIR